MDLQLTVFEWLINNGVNNDNNDGNVENMVANGRNMRRSSRILRPRINWFDLCSDAQFQSRFRLCKLDVLYMLERIEGPLRHLTEKNNAIPPIIQLLVAIRFYATGCFLITVGDFCGISKASAHTIVHRVSPLIASLGNEFIKFPSTEEELKRTAGLNFQQAGFPRAIGAIDCIHIRIQSYGGDDAELFRNRKGFFSINVQVIVNSELEILDIVARWPGSVHDATIFNNSRIKARFES
ncbi:putative nuclease HARBI1 [Prorops nasuta]|uniref:putative nuclease HARBI1 n=1 Tax=Prorops nasuta TaxID=863751 RepID=UPI0034CD2A65